MLSTLPKLADKAFIIGFFIPTLLFVLVVAALFCDQPWAQEIFSSVSTENGWDKLAYFVLAVWVLSTLLMMFNLIEMQILEGYRWPVSKIARFKTGEEKRFDPRNNEFTALDDEWRSFVDRGESFPEERRKRWESLRTDLVKEFPTERDKLLPTRLGNALRAFEGYSREVYGVDSIPLWLHLSTVMSEDFQSAIEDARAQVNCAVNIAVLAGIAAPLAVARLLWTLDWHVGHSLRDFVTMFNWLSLAYVLAAVAAAAISRFAYLFAIELAYTWGDLVKSAFDCFLPALAEKLGYKLPTTGDERQAFWRAVSEQAIYWKPIAPEQWKPPEKEEAANKPTYTINEITEILNLTPR